MALLHSKEFDVVVTDMLMPDLEGTEVVQAVRKNQPQASVLAMSGGGFKLPPELCLKIAEHMGAVVTLTKPFRVEDLLQAINTVMLK